MRKFPAIPTAPDAPQAAPEPGFEGDENTPPVPALAPAITTPAGAAPEDESSQAPVQPLRTEQLYNAVRGLDPDRASQVAQLSRAVQEPAAFVDKNLKDVRDAVNAPSTSFFAQLEQQHPETAKFLTAAPENMASAKDDIPNLAEHERLVKGVTTAHGYADAFISGLQGSSLGLGVRGKMPDVELPQGAPMLERLTAQAGTLLGDFPAMIAGAVGGGVGAGPLGGAAASFALPAAIRTYLTQQYQKGNVQGATDFLQRYYDIVKESAKSGLVGLAGMGAGALGGKLAGAAAGGLADYIGPVAADALTKSAVTAGKIGAEGIAIPLASSAEEGRLPSQQDVLDSLLLLGAMHGAGAAGDALMSRFSADRAADAQAFYDSIGKRASESKLLSRDPETYEKHIAGLTADTPVETVSIPRARFEEYFQSKQMDPTVVADQLGAADSYAESKETGGDVRVPFSSWVSKLAPTEHYQGLRDDVRFSDGDLTRREAQELQQAVTETTKSAEAQAQRETQNADVAESAERVREKIEEQLTAAGLSPAEAEHDPKLLSAFYSTLAHATGQTPEQLFERFPLQVKRAETATGEGYDQSQFARRGETDQTRYPLPERVTVATAEHVPYTGGKKAVEAAAWGEDVTPQGTFTNGPTGLPITVDEDTINKAASHATRELGLKDNRARAKQHLEALPYLQSLVENAAFLSEKPEMKGREQNQNWLYFFAPLEMDGKPFFAKLEVKKEAQGLRLHNYAIVPAGEGFGASGSEEPVTPAVSAAPTGAVDSSAPRTMSIQDFGNRLNPLRDRYQFFQSATPTAPPFYSKLTRTIEEKMGNSATADQVRGIIRDVKPEERKWLGIDDFLKGKEKVSKAELLEFLRANQLEVREVTRGGVSPKAQAREDFLATAEEYGLSLNDAQTMADDIQVGHDVQVPEELRGSAEALARQAERAPALPLQTKFERYTLPGGENYREVLFTLPEEKPNLPTYTPEEIAAHAEKFNAAVEPFNRGIREGTLTDSRGRIPDVIELALEQGRLTQADVDLMTDMNRHRFKEKPRDPNAYRSPHWNEPNVLAHVRLSDRTDADGKKVLHVEEIQSDWHQEGRKKGYKGDNPEAENLAARYDKARTAVEEARNKLRANLPQDLLGFDTRGEAINAIRDHADFAERWNIKEPELLELANDYRAKVAEMLEIEPQVTRGEGVPDAPFRKTWHEFALKRILRMAAEGGYDRVTWTTGEQQAERYSLENHVGSIDYKKTSDGRFHVEVFDTNDFHIGAASKEYTEGELEATFGKEIAKKIVGGEGTPGKGGEGKTQKGWTKLEGAENLKVGGEGMRGFYDKILPDAANKLVKKYGAKVGAAEVETEKHGGEHLQYKGPELSPDQILAAKSKADSVATHFQFDDIAKAVSEGMTTKQAVERFGSPSTAEDLGGEADWVGGPVLEKVHSLDITPALRDAALNEGFPLFQSGDEGPRGRIRIGGAEFNVDLFKSADKSTFLHETGHYFLEVLGRLATDESAPQALKDDYAQVLKFLGVDSREAIGTEQHEKWARAFEKYLAEGEAPSVGLRAAFDRFKQWLVGIYGSLRNLNVELSPEIRGVMDRLLATQEEIEEAQRTSGQRAEMVENLPPEVARRLSDLEMQARSQAESTLLKPMMEELAERNREFLDKERARLTKEATAEAKELPVYRAMDGLQKASRRNATDLAHLFLDDRVNDQVAANFEAAAETHGFASGEELARKIVEADAHGGLDGEVKARVEAGMAQHAPLMDRALIKEKALEAVHNDKMTEMLALERQALEDLIDRASIRAEASRRNREEAKIEVDAVRRQAREILDKKPLKAASNAGPYITGERNAAVKVSKALAKKDYEAAAAAKREQLVNHALATEAMRNKERAEKAIDALEARAKEGRDFTKMPYGFARQADALLAKFGFKDAPEPEDTENLKAIAQTMDARDESAADIANATGLRKNGAGDWVPETLSDFVTRLNDSYFPIGLPDVVTGPEKPYRELTVPELQDVKIAVDMISKLGKNFDRFLEEFKQTDINAAGLEFAKSVEENFGHPEAKNLQLGKPPTGPIDRVLGTLGSIPKFLARWMDTMLTTADKLDGLKADGPAKAYIYRPLADAESRRLARTRVEMEALDALFAKHFKEGELQQYKNTNVQVPNGNNVSKLQLLSMLLNWGNEGNRDRVMRAEGMTPGQVEALLFQHLTRRDFDFAQGVWDYLEKFKPEIKALEMEVNGTEPKWVEPAPIVAAWGAYRGGYYPISYDPERSASAYQHTEVKTALYKQYGAAKAQTEQGHTIARVDSLRRPMRYEMDVLTNHVEDVIHDLEFRRPVIDVARFLQQKDAKAALINALGVRGYNGISDWLKAVASAPSEPLHFGEGVARWLRFRTTMFYMGYRIASMPKIFLENLNNVSAELGVSTAARAIKDYYTGESGLHEYVLSKSEFMRQRAEHLDRDMGDVYSKYEKGDSLIGNFHKFAFWTHAMLDQAVSFPLWTHVFKQAVAAGEDEGAARQKADEAVKRTFMSGGGVDQAAVMRGSEAQKALTVALGYQSMMWNRYSRQLFDIEQTFKKSGPVDAALVAARAHFFTFVMPAAIAVLTREMLHNSQVTASPDERKKRALGNALEEATPLKFIPVARDVFPYFIEKSLGEHGSDLQVTPLERAAQSLLDPAAEAFKHAFTGQPLTPRFPEKAANAVSLLAPIPKTVDDIVFNFLDWQKEHGSATWKDFVTRRSKR